MPAIEVTEYWVYNFEEDGCLLDSNGETLVVNNPDKAYQIPQDDPHQEPLHLVKKSHYDNLNEAYNEAMAVIKLLKGLTPYDQD